MQARAVAQPHLEYRPTGFHWRRRLPRAARARSGSDLPKKSSFVFPLRTHVPVQAKTLALRLTLLSDIAFAAWTERTMAIAPDIMERLLTELCRFLIEAADLAREVAPARTAEAAAYEQACAQAAIDTLRQAIQHRDREAARQPLREVATRLGIALDEADPDWQRLAMRALRVMIEAGEEDLRRDQGLFASDSAVFRTARQFLEGAPAVMPALPPRILLATGPAASPAAPALPACSADAAVAAPASQGPDHPAGLAMAAAGEAADEGADPAPAPPAKRPGSPGHDARQCPSMLLGDAFDLHYEMRSAGYTDAFDEMEVPTSAAGRKWERSSGNGAKVAKRLWVSLLGNRPIAEIPDSDIREAKALIKRLPETHGKSCHETGNLRRLVEETDAEEQRAIEQAVARATLSGGSPAAIERARLDARIPRLRVETILKHVRALNQPAKMLVKMGKLEKSPFDKHMISNKSADNMRKTEEKRDRRPWDDRLYQLLRTPAFQGKANGVGDPMFWTPLMALLGGDREEEILQLSPEDFETSGGIHYYRIRRAPGQSVKSDAGDRLIPVHPELIRLGLLDLVELRRKEGEPRLFPHLQRGRHKETYT